jgi:hypothetical protein
MYTPADKSQVQARAIKQGKYKLAAVHGKITDWITKQFGVHALDFSCETRETSKGSPQQLIHVIVETGEDVKKIQADRANNLKIAERFLQYFKSTNPGDLMLDALKADVFAFETNPHPEIIVTCRPLKELDKNVIQEIREDEQRAVLKTFECVWTISMAVVFYYTDSQIKENLANGISAKINEELARVDTKYGIDRGTAYRFDSKETFDRDYESNWYYYWK